MSRDTNVESCKERVAKRTQAAEQGERMRFWINAVPVVGAPLAVGLAWLHPLLGSVTVAALTLAWLVGIYRTELLCQVTAGRLQDAEQDLSQAESRYASRHDRVFEPESLSPVLWSTTGARSRKGKAAHPPVYRH